MIVGLLPNSNDGCKQGVTRSTSVVNFLTLAVSCHQPKLDNSTTYPSPFPNVSFGHESNWTVCVSLMCRNTWGIISVWIAYTQTQQGKQVEATPQKEACAAGRGLISCMQSRSLLVPDAFSRAAGPPAGRPTDRPGARLFRRRAWPLRRQGRRVTPPRHSRGPPRFLLCSYSNHVLARRRRPAATGASSSSCVPSC